MTSPDVGTALAKPIQEGVWRHIQTAIIETNGQILADTDRVVVDAITAGVIGYFTVAVGALGAEDSSAFINLIIKVSLWQAAR